MAKPLLQRHGSVQKVGKGVSSIECNSLLFHLPAYVRANIQHTGMCRIHISDFSLRDLDLDLSHVQATNQTRAHMKCNTTSPSQQAGIMIISSHESSPANASSPTFTDTPRKEYSDGDLEAIFEKFCNVRPTSTSQWYSLAQPRY